MGASARFNVFGFMLLEAYYAYPFQRPDKGWHWGFQLAPGCDKTPMMFDCR